MNDFEILSGDTVVALWKNGVLEVINDTLLPLFFKRVRNVEMWLETRAIDSHRANSRLLKKALRLAEKDDVSTVIHVNAATVTDNYWIRPIGSELVYDDVKFTDDYFSDLALKGNYDSFNLAAASERSKTPELTNVGSFEKCWKIKDGKWCMYKKASHSEMFSELFVYELGSALGMSMAKYERGKGYIKSYDFTDGGAVNFEPASSFMGDNEDYFAVVKELRRLCPEAVPDYVKMIFMDTVCANPDRHTNNFGLLRNTSDGEIIGLAPNFDNNMALISRGYPLLPRSGDILIDLFNELTEANNEFFKYIPKITESDVSAVIEKINMRVRKQEVTELVMKRYELLKRK